MMVSFFFLHQLKLTLGEAAASSEAKARQVSSDGQERRPMAVANKRETTSIFIHIHKWRLQWEERDTVYIIKYTYIYIYIIIYYNYIIIILYYIYRKTYIYQRWIFQTMFESLRT